MKRFTLSLLTLLMTSFVFAPAVLADDNSFDRQNNDALDLDQGSLTDRVLFNRTHRDGAD